MIDRSYFIYIHRRHDTGDVFYVGKGTRTRSKGYNRAYTNYGRNEIWKHIVRKTQYSVELVVDFFLEDSAFDFEIELIAKYIMRCNGGTLCNIAAGGGHAGVSPSTETRAKLRKALSGQNHPNWGKKLSMATCRKKSDSMKSSPHNLRGKKLPESWRNKIAITKIGERNPMYGKTGVMHPMSRRVRDVITEQVYDNVRIASESTGYKMKTLYNWLSGHRSNPTTMEFA